MLFSSLSLCETAGSSFKAKWPSLISYPVLSCESQKVGAERIYGSSAAPWSGRERLDPGWGLLNASSCSAGSWLCIAKRKTQHCSERWRVEQLKMNAFNSKEKKNVFFPRKLCFLLFFPISNRATVVHTLKGVWTPHCPTSTVLWTSIALVSLWLLILEYLEALAYPTPALNNACGSDRRETRTVF